jgi:uncharacterized membrane protein YbhN (UPF0104 family)
VTGTADGRRVSAARSWAAWIASVLVAVALLGYLLRGVDARRMLDTAWNASPGSLLAFATIFAAGVTARTARFWILLGRTLPFGTVFAITLVRNLLVDLLPARLGELSYVYLVTTKGRRPVEDGVATLAVSFLLDLVALSPLVLAALLIVGGGSSVPLWVAWTASGVLAGVGMAALMVASPLARAVSASLRRRTTSARMTTASDRLSALADSVDAAKAQHVLVPALLLSVIVRLCKYGSAYFLVLSLLIPLGYSMEELGVFRIFLGSVAAEVAASLPVHGLAGFGTHEAAWTLTLQELGYPREHAVISGFLAHAITQATEYVLGGAALLWLYGRRPS